MGRKHVRNAAHKIASEKGGVSLQIIERNALVMSVRAKHPAAGVAVQRGGVVEEGFDTDLKGKNNIYDICTYITPDLTNHAFTYIGTIPYHPLSDVLRGCHSSSCLPVVQNNNIICLPNIVLVPFR